MTKVKKEAENQRFVVKLGLTLFLITAITAVMLAGINALTKEPIAILANEARNSAMQTIMPDGTIIENKTVTTESLTIYTLERPNGSFGYCVEVAPNGYGGPINMVVGIEIVSKDNQFEKRVVGVSITSMEETAGLGSKAKDESFLSLYDGLSYSVINEDGTLNIEPSAITVGRGDVDVDAITGATVTSLAVTKGVNTALDAINVSIDGVVTFNTNADATSGATASGSGIEQNINLKFINIDNIGEVVC